MKKIIIIAAIALFAITANLRSQTAVTKNDKAQITKEQCSANKCAGKCTSDKSKCTKSTNCKKESDKSVTTDKTCKSMCKGINNCMTSTGTKCDSTLCKNSGAKCKSTEKCKMNNK